MKLATIKEDVLKYGFPLFYPHEDRLQNPFAIVGGDLYGSHSKIFVPKYLHNHIKNDRIMEGYLRTERGITHDSDGHRIYELDNRETDSKEFLVILQCESLVGTRYQILIREKNFILAHLKKNAICIFTWRGIDYQVIHKEENGKPSLCIEDG